MPANSLPLDLLARLDPVQVKEYARATGWVREPRISDGRIAVFAHPTSDLDQIIVPLNRAAPDFARAMADVVPILAEKEGRPASEILNDLLLPPADVLRFGESGPAATAGDVPLDHGISLLSVARKALLAAACSEKRPQKFHPRLSLAEAEQLLQQCRLGQTERGSFIVTVACPLNAVPAPDPLLDRTPFARRVTSLLMRALHRLAQALDADELDPLLEPAEGEPVLSANLCEGLLDMMPEGEGSSLIISASWARTLPPPAAVLLPGRVQLRHETFGLIESLAQRLHPPLVPQRQVLIGFVDSLNGRPSNGRPSADGRMEGQVILQVLTPESEFLRARADLGAGDYHVAWLAHGENRPITLRGVLRWGRRIHRIDDVTDFHLLESPASQPEPT